jgi:hypothetical protein
MCRYLADGSQTDTTAPARPAGYDALSCRHDTTASLLEGAKKSRARARYLWIGTASSVSHMRFVSKALWAPNETPSNCLAASTLSQKLRYNPRNARWRSHHMCWRGRGFAFSRSAASNPAGRLAYTAHSSTRCHYHRWFTHAAQFVLATCLGVSESSCWVARSIGMARVVAEVISAQNSCQRHHVSCACKQQQRMETIAGAAVRRT